MPVPAIYVISGRSHAGNRLACQEFMILPMGASSFKDMMMIGAEGCYNMKTCIKERKYGQEACDAADSPRRAFEDEMCVLPPVCFGLHSCLRRTAARRVPAAPPCRD